LKYLFNPPSLIKFFFKDFYWQTSNGKILLTFDDGPTETATPKILQILKKNNIKAAFFCVGENVIKYPDLVRQMINEGHLIGNHTMKHKLLGKIIPAEALQEIKSFNILLKEKFNYDVNYLRPPHGRFNLRTNRLLKKLDIKCVMWNLLSHDYENNFETVKYGIDRFLSSSSIIVFHDSAKSESIIEDSIQYTINKAAGKKFHFGDPEECLK